MKDKSINFRINDAAYGPNGRFHHLRCRLDISWRLVPTALYINGNNNPDMHWRIVYNTFVI